MAPGAPPYTRSGYGRPRVGTRYDEEFNPIKPYIVVWARIWEENSHGETESDAVYHGSPGPRTPLISYKTVNVYMYS